MQPETGAQCANNTDDDADGEVNDGCPPSGGAETGAQCHNNIDDDGDGGIVNDGCSYLYSVETGAECTNGIDDDARHRCQRRMSGRRAGYRRGRQPRSRSQLPAPDEDEEIPPNTAPSAKCLDSIDDDGDGVINDGCPQVGVYSPMGPTFTTPPLKYMQASGPPNNPTFYIPVSSGGKSRLMRFAGPFNPTATLSNAFGSGLTTLDNIASARHREPRPDRDVHGRAERPAQALRRRRHGPKVRSRTDGGATWKPDAELTALVTNNGQYNWNTPGGSTVWSLDVRSRGRSKIMVGTEYAGAYASVDGGADWFNVGGSTNNVPKITSFFFDEDRNKIYASSYGHSLWVISLPTTDLKVTKTD